MLRVPKGELEEKKHQKDLDEWRLMTEKIELEWIKKTAKDRQHWKAQW